MGRLTVHFTRKLESINIRPTNVSSKALNLKECCMCKNCYNYTISTIF